MMCAGQSRGTLKREKMLFLDLAPPTLKYSGIFHDSTRPHLHFDVLPPKSRRSVVSIGLGCVTRLPLTIYLFSQWVSVFAYGVRRETFSCLLHLDWLKIQTGFGAKLVWPAPCRLGQ